MWNYKEIYMPDHPHSRNNGCILEHRYVAEKKIGRVLSPKEVVHHRDENRDNNDPENLVVFSTASDHARFHQIGVMIENGDGTYHSPEIQTICKNCKKLFKSNSKRFKNCSVKCSSMTTRKVSRPTKTELEDLLKSHPMTIIGGMFGVSDNAVRRWCKSYDLPYRKKDILLLKHRGLV